jgi:acyl carrier protein
MTEDLRTAVEREPLRALVAETLELPAAEVTDTAHFSDDLDVDSLMALELSVALEKRYGITMEDSDLKNATTLVQVQRLVEDKLGLRG